MSADAFHLLVVDDEPAFSESVKFALQGIDIEGRPVEVHSESSAASAYRRLCEVDDSFFAVILVDVVMEHNESGLALVQRLREELRFTSPRVVICTGHPGFAPPIDVVRNLDIDGYRLKSSLSRDDIICMVLTYIRSFQTLLKLTQIHLDLHWAANSIAQVSARGDTQAVADEAVQQLTAMQQISAAAVFLSDDQQQCRLLASSSQASGNDEFRINWAQQCLNDKRNVLTDDGLAVYGPSTDYELVLIVCSTALDRVSTNIIRTFATAFFSCYWAAQAKERLIETERKAATGAAAAGIVHEINGPMTFVGARLEQLMPMLSDLPESQRLDAVDHLKSIGEGVDRVREIIDTMFQIYRGTQTEAGPVRLSKVVKEAVRMVSPGLAQPVRLHVVDTAPDCHVFGQEAAILQVVMNLVRNAAESFLPDADECNIHLSWRTEGSSVVLKVQDNGRGMTPDVLRRATERIFTTKDGTGTGIGLAICRKLLGDFGACIQLRSEVGRGTVVEVTFETAEQPRTLQNQSEALESREVPEEPHPTDEPQVATALVVEDDPRIGSLYPLCLKDFNVAVVETHREAIDFVEHNDVQFALIDYHMQDGSAADLLSRLFALNPDLQHRSAIVTGVANAPAVREVSERFHLPILQKPFGIPELRKLASELSRPEVDV